MLETEHAGPVRVSSDVKAKTPSRFAAIGKRIIGLLIFGLIAGWLVHHAEVALERRNKPAGFVHGLVQGALMPIALPNLAVGKDVPIYAEKNLGRVYKLGYTLGVNACGLIFFGFFFWRVRKLKAGLNQPGRPQCTSPALNP